MPSLAKAARVNHRPEIMQRAKLLLAREPKPANVNETSPRNERHPILQLPAKWGNQRAHRRAAFWKPENSNKMRKSTL